MSDEPMPPPLRLKPRVHSQPEQTGASASPANELSTPAPAVSSPIEAAAGSKLRLKPKLGASEPAAEPAATSEPERAAEPILPALPPIELPRAKLRITAVPAGAGASAPAPADILPTPSATAPAPDPTPEPLKFKLKTAPSEVRSTTEPAGLPTVLSTLSLPPIAAPKPSAAPTPAASLPIPVATRSLATPAPFPVLANTPAPAHTPPATTSVPHLRAPTNVGEEELLASLPDAQASAKKRRMIAGLAVVLVLAGGAAYVLLRPAEETAPPVLSKTAVPTVSAKTSESPTVQPAVPATTDAPKPGPTPSATLNQIAAAPGQAIAKAQAVVDARRQLENDRVEASGLGEEPSGKSASNSGQKSAPAIPVTATAEVAPGVIATARTSEMVGAANPVFQAWVANARINGVFHGQPPRALVNGRTVRAGQLIDEELGITFDSLNPAAKTIKFRDRTGAVVSRRY